MSGTRLTILKLGVFAAVMVLLTALLFVIFAQYRTGSTNSYSAVFTDVSGLKAGDSVRAAGMRVGTVKNLSMQPDDTVVATFDADWAGHRITPSTGTGDLVWSPGAAAAIVRMIGSARRSIALEDEEMAYAPATSALCAAARRGVAVTIVMTWESDWYDAFSQLKHCGVNVRVDHGQSYYIHAKVLVVDGRRALVSSQNLSDGSLERNRELGIVVSSGPLVRALAADVAADAASAPAFYY